MSEHTGKVEKDIATCELDERPAIGDGVMAEIDKDCTGCGNGSGGGPGSSITLGEWLGPKPPTTKRAGKERIDQLKPRAHKKKHNGGCYHGKSWLEGRTFGAG